MNVPVSNNEEELRAHYRRLDLHEEDIKRRLELDKQNLEAVRQLKKQIAEQIFSASAASGSRTSLNEVTTAYNGKHSTGSPRP